MSKTSLVKVVFTLIIIQCVISELVVESAKPSSEDLLVFADEGDNNSVVGGGNKRNKKELAKIRKIRWAQKDAKNDETTTEHEEEDDDGDGKKHDADDDDDDDEEFDFNQILLDSLNQSRAGELYLPEGYNKLEIPKSKIRFGDEDDDETEVEVHLNIREIVEINEANDELAFEMDLVIHWLDQALASAKLEEYFRKRLEKNVPDLEEIDEGIEEVENLPQKNLDPIFLSRIWKPDIFVEELIDVNQPRLLRSRPATLKFAVNGIITYCSRSTIKIACDFDFKYYPADTQKCSVTMRSYSHNYTELLLRWRRPVGVYLLYPADDNFDIAVGAIRKFRLMTFIDQTKSSNETFDTLQFKIFLRRRLSYHIIQTYIPSMLYIAITWLCYMVPKRMIEARMAIVMTTLLTLTSMFSSVRESTPVVSYTKAIDIWVVACIAFVFGVLLEFAILLWCESSKHAEEEEKKKQNEGAAEGEGIKNHQNEKPAPKTITQQIRSKLLQLATTGVTFFEDFSFIIILTIFVIFNTVYWAWILIASGYFDWEVDNRHNAVASSPSSTDEKEIEELNPFR